MSRAIRIAVAGAIIAASCLPSMAQPVRLRGTIEKVEGGALTLRTSESAELRLTLTEGALVVAVVKASMADIKEGTYLGSAAMPQPDGSQMALEVHIFPEQMRGTGEGHRPYPPVPQSTMTNGATAGAIVAGTDGSRFVVRFRDGEKQIVVPPNVPIVRYEIGNAGDLKVGPGSLYSPQPGSRMARGRPIASTSVATASYRSRHSPAPLAMHRGHRFFGRRGERMSPIDECQLHALIT